MLKDLRFFFTKLIHLYTWWLKVFKVSLSNINMNLLHVEQVWVGIESQSGVFLTNWSKTALQCNTVLLYLWYIFMWFYCCSILISSEFPVVNWSQTSWTSWEVPVWTAPGAKTLIQHLQELVPPAAARLQPGAWTERSYSTQTVLTTLFITRLFS